MNCIYQTLGTSILIFAVLFTCSPGLGANPQNSQEFTLQSQADGKLINVEQRRIDVRFIDKSNIIATRPIRLFIPLGTPAPRPLIFVPHYEITENSAELRQYLAEGWTVASPFDFQSQYNATLTDDNLVFNSAALYTLRNLEDVDPQRIALVGGSAGGYTALMLSALHLGVCASIANSPISNIYFNLYQYFPESIKFNVPEKKKDTPEGQRAIEKLGPFGEILSKFPMPILAAIIDSFIPILDNFPNPDDTARWEAFSPVGLADCFTSPIVINHLTSDVLVPIDQISKKYAYVENGKSMPEGLNVHLNESNPGVLGRSLEEELPADQTTVNYVKNTDIDGDVVMAFDVQKLFTINICDDGPTEGYGGHRASESKGSIDQIPFLRDKLAQSCAKTETITSDKILLLLERYQGKSVQLPAHSGVDDNTYGSLVVYQNEVVDEFAQWAHNHSLKELDEAVRIAIASLDSSQRTEYELTWKTIQGQISERGLEI